MIAPIVTSRQAMRALGSILKITANRAVTTANENAVEMASATGANQEAVQSAPQKRSTTASAALTTSETSSMKASASTMLNDSTRARSSVFQPAPAGGGACQISSRLLLSSAKALVAPTSRMPNAMAAATPPPPARCVAARISWMAAAPCSPTRPLSWEKISPRAASAPKNRPAIEITSTRIGASENNI
ncbi:hypothetical protein D3C87_1315570 [compost metagenome]